MKESKIFIICFSLVSLFLLLPSCSNTYADTKDLSEGISYSLPNGGIIYYQTEEENIALVCMNRDSTRNFIAQIEHGKTTILELLSKIFNGDISWETEIQLPEDFLIAQYIANSFPAEAILNANGYALMEITDSFSGDNINPTISISGWETHPSYIMPKDAQEIMCWMANDVSASLPSSASVESKPRLTAEEADAEIQRRLDEQLSLISPQLEAQNALDQLDLYKEIFEEEIQYEVYQEFEIIE